MNVGPRIAQSEEKKQSVVPHQWFRKNDQVARLCRVYDIVSAVNHGLGRGEIRCQAWGSLTSRRFLVASVSELYCKPWRCNHEHSAKFTHFTTRHNLHRRTGLLRMCSFSRVTGLPKEPHIPPFNVSIHFGTCNPNTPLYDISNTPTLGLWVVQVSRAILSTNSHFIHLSQSASQENLTRNGTRHGQYID